MVKDCFGHITWQRSHFFRLLVAKASNLFRVVSVMVLTARFKFANVDLDQLKRDSEDKEDEHRYEDNVNVPSNRAGFEATFTVEPPERETVALLLNLFPV